MVMLLAVGGGWKHQYGWLMQGGTSMLVDTCLFKDVRNIMRESL